MNIMNIMPSNHRLFTSIVIASLFFTGATSGANLVYFREGPSRLYDFNTDTKATAFRINLSPGGRLFSLDVRPDDGAIFGINAGTSPATLVSVDLYTGAWTNIGVLHSNSTALAFEPGTGTLWSVGFAPGTFQRRLLTINPTNAVETLVGDLPFAGYGADALAFLSDGTLFYYESILDYPQPNGRLYRLNRTNAEPTLIAAITPSIPDLQDFAHVGNRLFATSFGHGTTAVWEIDPTWGQATALAPSDGLGYGGVIALPPLSKLTIAVAAISLKWPTTLGKTYQLQYQSPRTANLWTNLGTPIQGTGNDISVLDSVGDDIQRTYRLQMLP
jgi:hypothetical protein